MFGPLAQEVIIQQTTHWLLLRLNIEHYMLGVIIGRGGLDYLGATLWGQTEMSVFDDGQHGVWGMTYKYHERAIVFNERNMHRIWDVAYDGYVGGKNVDIMKWHDANSRNKFQQCHDDMTREYCGPSIVVLPLPRNERTTYLPSPILLANYDDTELNNDAMLATSEDFVHNIVNFVREVKDKINNQQICTIISNFCTWLHNGTPPQILKTASDATMQNEATGTRLLYAGTSMWGKRDGQGAEYTWTHRNGNGHHGADYTGVASVRNGKSLASTAAPMLQIRNNTNTN